MSISSIKIPIIKRIKVDGYLVYPGNDQSGGLDHPFFGGVNVIVGINGIGKTTLLTIIYRMLAGDQDLKGSGNERLGGTARTLVHVDSSIFAVRVPDRAVNAEATLTFSLGGRDVTIKRSLKNLQITELSVNPERPALNNFDDLDARYKEWVRQLAGVDDFYDWMLILKYLVFYLEDRRSLVWDESAQSEMYRILFSPEGVNANYKALFNAALSADSTARNTQAVLKREEGRLDKLKAEAGNGGSDDLPLLRASVAGLQKQIDNLTEQLFEADRNRHALRDQGARLRNDAEELLQQERELREELLAALFPTLTDTGALALALISAEHGCIVCGTTDEAHLASAKKKLEESLACPLCGADRCIHEERVAGDSASSPRGQEDLAKISERQREVQDQAKLVLTQEMEAARTYLDIQNKKHACESELKVSKDRLIAAEYRAGLTEDSSIKNFEARLNGFRDTIADAIEEKNESLRTLKVMLDGISDKVKQFKDTLIDNFSINIKSFLAERCELTYQSASRNVGQSASPVTLLFPEFHVSMTSGVFRETGTPRDETSSVSESQKEFIELAFRMALLSAISSEGGCSLVIETPEANLDAVFIPRAGRALNDFASECGGVGSGATVIASSNLNGSQMIPALLGLVDVGENKSMHSSDDASSQRVLNLLKYAAKSAALRQFEVEYEEKLADAMRVQS